MTNSKAKQIVILGAAGTGLQIAESICRNSELVVLGFLDDDAEKRSDGYCDFPVLGGLRSWEDIPGECLFITSLYGPKKNVHFFDLVESLRIPDYRWATVIDPSATISATVKLGHGIYIGPGTVLQPMVHLGNYCAMLGNVYVGHESSFSDYVLCANSVSIAGRVSVGKASFIGANSTIREDVRVGTSAIVGMGSVVFGNIPDCEAVVGNPARAMSGLIRKI